MTKIEKELKDAIKVRAVAYAFIYDEMKNINAAVEEKGYISQEEERRVEYLTSAVEKKLEAEESGSYSFTEDVAMSANITQQLGAKLMNVYRSEAKNWYQ